MSREDWRTGSIPELPLLRKQKFKAKKGASMAEKTPPKITLKAARVNAGLTAKEVGEIVKKHYQTILSYEKDSENIPTGLLIELSEIYHYPMDFIFLGKTYGLNSIKEKAS
ncbi:repressor [Lactococcus cremoris]|nr:repressor [Lactococcus cremoris]